MGERLERGREVGKDEMKGEGKKKMKEEKTQHTHEGPNKCVDNLSPARTQLNINLKQAQHPEGSVKCLHFL